jgi:integrase/recombinase XerD
MTDARTLVPVLRRTELASLAPAVPAVLAEAGQPALTAWDDFFAASLRNRHTRAAYGHALRRFFDWLLHHPVPVERITPGMVGRYLSDHPGSPPTRKLHLAALRAFFDLLVVRHVVPLNPAAAVRSERYQVVEGKTPEIGVDQARQLLASVDVTTVVGFRDRALIAVLVYTAARGGAVAKLRVRHFTHDGSQWALRFDEKGGKSREIPVRHDLQGFILDYMAAAGLTPADRDAPLFQSAAGRSGRLTGRPMSNVDVCRLVKRRLADAGLPGQLSPHSFRVTTVTDLLSQGVPLEDVQHLAGHADPRTTRLYDRRGRRVTRNVVERISV